MKILKDKKKILDFFRNRYGIPEDVFTDVEFVETRRAIWMLSVDILKEENQPLLSLKRVNLAGLRILRKTGPESFKPTTYGLQIIGAKATRNVVQLSRDELKRLLQEGGIPFEGGEQKGFVIIRYRDRVLGCGLIKDGFLYSQFPKGRVEMLKNSELF